MVFAKNIEFSCFIRTGHFTLTFMFFLYTIERKGTKDRQRDKTKKRQRERETEGKRDRDREGERGKEKQKEIVTERDIKKDRNK